MLIYHIVLSEIWAAFETELYVHASLEGEGFIHCSFAEQLDAVIGRYYSGEESVIVLEIESDRLMSRMIKEPSTNREIYPHVYGPINRDAIISVRTACVSGRQTPQ
ncbi:MAG: DUF952 domain-containing protein [Pyrinomonadaceae bacterium]